MKIMGKNSQANGASDALVLAFMAIGLALAISVVLLVVLAVSPAHLAGVVQ